MTAHGVIGKKNKINENGLDHQTFFS